MDDDSTDIYKSNIIDIYSIRPAYVSSVNDMCFAAFAAYYYKDYNYNVSETIDSQPEVLSDDILDQTHEDTTDDASLALPKRIKLMNSKRVMKCRKVKAVLRYHTPNKTKELDKYFHHLLMFCYPWRQESDLLGNVQNNNLQVQ